MPDVFRGNNRVGAGFRNLACEEVSCLSVIDPTDRLPSAFSDRGRSVATDETIDSILVERQLFPLFQPIVDLKAHRILGYEGLIRGPAGSALHTPQRLFATAARDGRLYELDLLCQQIVLERFAALGLKGYLFMNVNPECLTDEGAASGQTLLAMAQTGVAPEQVVIELTEQQPIGDYSVMRDAIQRLREMGLATALDDLGAGYSSLRHWSELRPDYVKIDIHFVQNAHNEPIKRDFLHSIGEIAHSLGTKLIAEGVETRGEYDVVRSLDIPFAQGYHFGRPNHKPLRVLPHSQSNYGDTRLLPRQRTETAASLVKSNPVLSPNVTLGEAVERFQKAKELRCLPVVHEERPIGLLRRNEILMLYSQRYTRELHDRSSVQNFMLANPLLVPSGQPLEALSETITASSSLEEDFIIVDDGGRYLGMGLLIDLLRKITALQVRYARYSNPLTGLPGNVPIGEHIDRLLDLGSRFFVAYCDLDHFKPFNDYYGYARGDHVIRRMGEILRAVLRERDDFLGHVGGDDFVLVLTGDEWEGQCMQVLNHVELAAPGFYDEAERKTGGLQTQDRQGRENFFPILSLSIGVVPVTEGLFKSHLAVSRRASEVKHLAKLEAGNSLFVDRRRSAVPGDH